MRPTAADIRTASNRILASDPELARELSEIIKKRRPGWLRGSASAMNRLAGGYEGPRAAALEEAAPSFELETIVQRIGRPVLAITHGDTILAFRDAESAVWRTRLQEAAPRLHPVIGAIGRVEVSNFPMALPYVGTGWLVDSEVIVTNRHVALEFGDRGSKGFSFKLGFDRTSPIGADIDFLEEVGNEVRAQFTLSEILFIADDTGPDVAFLRVTRKQGDGLAVPVKLAQTLIPSQSLVATIGYPARDPRIPDQHLMEQVFGSVFDKKRLAPGFVTGIEGGALTHDCTTLGGNSGSAVIDLSTGEAAGLHNAGVFLKTNYAVPAPVVASLLRRLPEATYKVVSSEREPVKSVAAQTPVSRSERDGETMEPNDVTFTVPLQITVRLGTASGGPALPTPPSPAATTVRAGDLSQAGVVRRVGRKEVEAAVAMAREQLATRSDVVSIEPGYRFRDGWITDERCVVIGVKRKVDHQELAAAGTTLLPSEILGVPTDIRVAAVADPANQLLLEVLRAAKGQPVSNYKLRPDLPLNLIEDPMEVTLHASPDAGWPMLSEFLARAKNRLTVGMYEFTAPHIVTAVKDAVMPPGRRFSLVLQNRDDRRSGLTVNDTTEAETVQNLTDAVGKRLSFAWASVTGPNRLFDAAYHIKVAVRDGQEFWLSSGNWRSSNQPPYDPIKDGDQTPPLIQQGDRDWHAIVTHPGLAEVFEKHLLRDEEEAAALQEATPQPSEPEVWVPEEYFRPTEEELEAPVAYRRPLSIKRRVKVQPLLTPDNYAAHVVPLIQSATKSLYFQNQSLKVYGDNGQIYEELLQALLQKQQNSRVDVKIIFRRFGDPRTDLTALKDYGFDTNTDKIRVLTNSHTKGIVVDGESVLIGSQNWTKDGTAYNRDASLIFYDRAVASYFEELFLYDWGRSGKSGITESLPAVEVVKPDEEAPRPGRVRMPWSAWFGR